MRLLAEINMEVVGRATTAFITDGRSQDHQMKFWDTMHGPACDGAKQELIDWSEYADYD